MPAPETKAVLFDLGGVLVELSGIEHWKKLAGKQNDAEMWRDWLRCPVVRDYERGLCSTSEFGHGIVKRYNLDLEPEEFIDLFASWPNGLYPKALDVVNNVHNHLTVGCFSNTNELHWEGQNDWNQIQSLFQVHFLSYRMGHAKPDTSAFQHVAEVLECAPGEIFFIDDNALNVEAARECGFNAHLTKGPVEARRVLSENGLMQDNQ